MKTGRMSQLLTMGAVVLWVVALMRWRGPALPMTNVPSPMIPAAQPQIALPDDALESAEMRAIAHDPFRLSNRAPTARYDPSTDGAPSGAGAASPIGLRPSFVLKGIVGGPPWQAIIDGIPGREMGTVARQGSVYDRLVIRSVTRDSVIIQGPDTSWVLSFKKRS